VFHSGLVDCQAATIRQGGALPHAGSEEAPMGSQLYLPAGWARHLESRVDPSERLAELEKDRAEAKAHIHDIVERLAEKHGATARDATVAMRAIEHALVDLLSDQEHALQHELEDLTPV
jgi:hypothetical protein